jgi:hypothetical protein
MFRLGLLLIVVACIALAVTNPGIEDHKKIVYQNLPNQAGADGLLGEIAGKVLGNFDPLPLTYHNYYLFSTTTFRDDTMSFGLFTHVWPDDIDVAPAGE